MKKTPNLLFFAAALSLLAMVSCKEETLNLTPPDSASWKAQTRAEIDGLNGKFSGLHTAEMELLR